jgi:KDO2-lipid IV(A) lauroyltransferase
MKYLEYLFFMFQRGLISLIPLKLLYSYSDVIYFFLFHVFRYRLEIVRRNLQNSFPGKDSKEINDIIRKFYRNLADISVETLRGYSLDLPDLQNRYVFMNMKLPNRYYESKRDIILAMSHYCNWEWGSQVAGAVFRHSLFAFYKPLSNNLIDDYIKSHRAARKMTLLPVDRPRLLKPDKSKPAAYLFISDQNPGTSKVYWTRFLNQDTAFLRGIEVYAKHYNLPVQFVDIQRTRR